IEYKHAYIIFTEPTDKAVLHQMVGILISSFLMMLIIIFSFGYLIRVILRQRSLDEMKSDFTNNITHELKTPIAVAYAANDALLHFKQGEIKEQRDRYLQISMEQLQRLSHLVEQILSMSMERRRTLTLHLEKIVMRELMKPLIEQQKLKAKKTVEVIYVEEPEGLTVVADRTHLGNIISNLLDNAIKYSGESVTVAICCRTDDEGNIVVSVRDNGIGISADSQKHIFEKFYRVPTGNKHDSKGYGLGLYYVNTILTKMNGSIRVESEPGKGSIFIVTLWKEKG
ncbi:MAG: HAMP domain-containing sensor histidine kinase, partial [Parabacteroides sp.]